MCRRRSARRALHSRRHELVNVDVLLGAGEIVRPCDPAIASADGAEPVRCVSRFKKTVGKDCLSDSGAGQVVSVLLLLRLRKTEISAETEEAFDAMRMMLAYLSKAYLQMKEGNMDFLQN